MVHPDRPPQSHLEPQTIDQNLPLLVGRNHELSRLREQLDAAVDGHGSLVLIGGEAGIGKTSLAGAVARETLDGDILLLTGHCYDLTATPPYGPWVEALQISSSADVPEAARTLLRNPAELGDAQHQGELFEQIWNVFVSLAAMQPLVLVLEDLHWSDPASLDLLRFIARRVRDVPMLLLATYRDDELSRHHPLFQLMPVLVRETRAERISLHRFGMESTRTLVRTHCALSHADEERLVGHLQQRTDGNPFFMTELVRTIEDDGLLHQTGNGWELADLSQTHVPALLRQTIEGRLSQLSDETRQELQIAATIGQEVPLDLWQTVSALQSDVLLAVIDEALDAQMIREAPDGASFRFRHALVREAIYEGVALPRRRIWHRRVAEALAATGQTVPDMVAYHFQQAGDGRAVEWHIRAGLRARATAWINAAHHFETAAAMMEGDEVHERERGWLHFEAGFLLRFTRDQRAIDHMEAAEQSALATDDPLLLAFSYYSRGSQRCMHGDIRQGLRDLEQGVSAIDLLLDTRPIQSTETQALAIIRQLLPDPKPQHDRPGTPRSKAINSQPSVNLPRGILINWLGKTGRYHEAVATGEAFIDAVIASFGDDYLQRTQCAAGLLGLGHAYAGLGRPEDARRTLALARAGFRASIDYAMVEDTIWTEVLMTVIPYGTEQLAERARLVAEATEAWNRCRGITITTAGDGTPSELQLDLLEGRWQKARQLATDHLPSPWVTQAQEAVVTLGVLSWHRGETDQAWERVTQLLSQGPETEPGDSYFAHAITAIALAAELALDARDLTTARRWIEAHDHWLDWSRARLWQADNQLLWARLAEMSGDLALAEQHAERALAHASNPRQPLRLVAAHRYLGRLESHKRQFSSAEAHLDQSLTLASACAAPFERALTQLALAELHIDSGRAQEAHTTLDEVRAICVPLHAAPTIARVDALRDRLVTQATPVPVYPDRLTTREVEVLRLIAAGRSNREIANTLFLSTRTVERHIANIYLKIDTHSKAEATAYAFRNGLVDDPMAPA